MRAQPLGSGSAGGPRITGRPGIVPSRTAAPSDRGLQCGPWVAEPARAAPVASPAALAGVQVRVQVRFVTRPKSRAMRAGHKAAWQPPMVSSTSMASNWQCHANIRVSLHLWHEKRAHSECCGIAERVQTLPQTTSIKAVMSVVAVSSEPVVLFVHYTCTGGPPTIGPSQAGNSISSRERSLSSHCPSLLLLQSDWSKVSGRNGLGSSKASGKKKSGIHSRQVIAHKGQFSSHVLRRHHRRLQRTL